MITDDHKSTKKRSREGETTQDTQVSDSPIQVKAELPVIQRVIPAEGPMTGGTEITVLGSAFRPGLSCIFGSNESAKTQFWGESTLLAVLPPSVVSTQLGLVKTTTGNQQLD